MLAFIVICLAAAPDAFPWSGSRTLKGADGTVLTWTVKREEGRVVIEGKHTLWSVVHVARPDGTPVSTEKTFRGKTARVRYSATRADFQPGGSTKTLELKEDGLWDAETLDARLAGIAWAAGKQVRFKILDPDSDDGSVYPMIAEGLGLEKCGAESCQVVRLTLDGWRRPFGPTVLFRYRADASAEYVGNVNDGKELKRVE